MTREPNPYAKDPALTTNSAVVMSVPSIVIEDVLDGPDVVDAQHQKNADIHVSSADREKWNGVADSIDSKLEDLQLDIAGVSDSVDTKLEDLQVNILGEEFEDTLHWSDPAVETTHAISYMSSGAIPGFEEPVERDSCIRALRLFNKRQTWTWVNEEFEYYCIFTAYTPSGEITGTVRGVFVITTQDAYVEFDTPLDVFAGGKIKFEFGMYHIPEKQDQGLGTAMALDSYNMTAGWLVKKVGARLLESPSNSGIPMGADEIPDHTLFRTIYYKKTGAVAEKIAEHAADANARTTEIVEDLQINILGEEFEDILHWSDPTVEYYLFNAYYENQPLPGFEEPVERDGYIRALRLFNRNQYVDTSWINGDMEYYCLFTTYNSGGEITGTTRGVFVITTQDAYVEFDTPLSVSAGGKIKFEFGGYYIPEKDDLGIGGAIVLGAYNMTDGYIVKKVGARLLEGSPTPALPYPNGAEGISDHTLYRAIYYKTPGAVDEKIAEHSTNTTVHITASEHTGLAELLAHKDELLALLNS